MKTCNGCDTPPNLSFAAFEVETARHERQQKFHQFLEILLIVAIVATNLTWAAVFDKNLDKGEKECSITSHTKTEDAPKIGGQPSE